MSFYLVLTVVMYFFYTSVGRKSVRTVPLDSKDGPDTFCFCIDV